MDSCERIDAAIVCFASRVTRQIINETLGTYAVSASAHVGIYVDRLVIVGQDDENEDDSPAPPPTNRVYV